MQNFTNNETSEQRNIIRQPPDLKPSYFNPQKAKQSSSQNQSLIHLKISSGENKSHHTQGQLQLQLQKSPFFNKQSIIFNNQSYQFRILTQEFRNNAIKLLANQFADQQPLSKAFCQQFPQQKSKMCQLWYQAWDLFIDHSIEDCLGVVLLDKSQNQKIIGVSMASLLSNLPKNIEQKLLNDFTVFPFNYEFEAELLNLAEPEHKNNLQKLSQVMDIIAVAIDKEYMGRQLLAKMIKVNEMLARKKQIRFSYVFASNFRTGVALKKLNYQKISQYPCKQFEMNGIHPYSMIEELHSHSSLWLKDLNK